MTVKTYVDMNNQSVELVCMDCGKTVGNFNHLGEVEDKHKVCPECTPRSVNNVDSSDTNE